MSRQPIHIESCGPRNNRQAIWEAIRLSHLRASNNDAGFSVADIRGRLCGATPLDKIRLYMESLCKARYLRRFEPKSKGEAIHYALINDVGIDAPRVRKDGSPVTQGLAQKRIWKTLKICRSPISIRALTAQVNTQEYPIALATVKSYLVHLHCAGYLSTRNNGDETQYLLIPARYTGPRPPMVQRIKQVFDPNIGKVVWPTGGDHE